jgi:hypothetical protein
MRNPWKLTTLFLAIVLAVVVGRGAGVSTVAADPQPHMKAALDSLEAGLSDLEKATADKGGHRAKAISLTKQAIGETKKGISFDNKH